MTGVPRAVKSVNRFFALSVLLLLSAALQWPSGSWTKFSPKYFKLQTVATMREAIQMSLVPLVTVCNISPLPDDVNPTPSWKEYLEDFEIENICWNIDANNQYGGRNESRL